MDKKIIVLGICKGDFGKSNINHQHEIVYSIKGICPTIPAVAYKSATKVIVCNKKKVCHEK